MLEHGARDVFEGPISAFGDSIVLGSVGGGAFVLDSEVVEEVDELLAHVLPPIVRTEGLDFESSLVGDEGFELAEALDELVLLLEEVDPAVA